MRWPSTDLLVKTMPATFRETFGTEVTVILACLEVLMNLPRSIITRSDTWYHYKHHNTVKFLIGICSEGSARYLSKAYGGRSSYKFITEDCGFLAKLRYGDVVVADRGFLIAESVGLCCASLHVPTSAKGKRQLEHSEVEYTKEVSNVRIHLEQVISLVRNKFRILKSNMPLEFLRSTGQDVAPIYKTAVVCCSLINTCHSVVPFE